MLEEKGDLEVPVARGGGPSSARLHPAQWRRSVRLGRDSPTAGDLHEVITDDEVRSGTTCRSRVEHCPVGTNQLDKVLELRRYLTNEGRWGQARGVRVSGDGA